MQQYYSTVHCIMNTQANLILSGKCILLQIYQFIYYAYPKTVTNTRIASDRNSNNTNKNIQLSGYSLYMN